MSQPVILYIHGKGGSAGEAEHYRPLFRSFDVVGFDYHAGTPWEAVEEFPPYFDSLAQKHDSVILIANSIGAYFAMQSLSGCKIEKAFLISPIVEMEKLILQMLSWAGANERELKEKGEIQTSFGETLSWEYLSYVRSHPIRWKIPTEILYGDRDNLTSYATMSDFAARMGAGLTVMPGGEHWFHTKEQMAFLDAWLKRHFPSI